MAHHANDDRWKEAVHALGGEQLVGLLEGILSTQVEILHRLDDVASQSSQSATDISELKKAFPANDTEGHRRYHELMIAQIEERRKLTSAIKEKTISGLVWMFIVFCGYSLLDKAKAVLVAAVKTQQ